MHCLHYPSEIIFPPAGRGRHIGNLPVRIKDYIATPKPNKYQSLHTTVMTSFGQPIEIQIRTEEMHRIAEFGIAAHWKYKSGDRSKEEIDKKLAWVAKLIEAEKEKLENTFSDTLGHWAENDILMASNNNVKSKNYASSSSGLSETDKYIVIETDHVVINLSKYTGSVASVTNKYDHTFTALPVIAAFMPLLAGLGGNIGTQSITLMVRGMSTGQVTLGSGWKYIWRETLTGISIGAIFGLLVSLVTWGWQHNAQLGLIVGAAMALNMTIATMIGTFAA